MNEGVGLTAWLIVVGICFVVVVAQVLANLFGAIDPGAAF